ncbi:TetR/AcrR family transcriptional regulator [Undibacterium sp. Di26W]|uniref:TetR/AcrR family transcriptional regulator n=1 Tax=Undibacterium sp. Di26W TaxID=3413035 RepID=UPI003BF3E1D5
MTTPRADVRQHILDTAKPIILGKGFSVVGLNEVLTAAAVPKGSFYHYFKSKELFGEALLDDYFAGYLAAIDVLLKTSEEPAAQRLMRYWQGWLPERPGESVQCQCLAAKLSGEVSDLSEAMRLALQHGTDSIIARLADCMREGIADGSLPADLDAAHCAQTLYAMWLGATLLAKIRRDMSSLENAMQATRKMLQL